MGALAFSPSSRRYHKIGNVYLEDRLKVSDYLINDPPTKGFCSRMVGFKCIWTQGEDFNLQLCEW